jgi:alanine dehydrogenase
VAIDQGGCFETSHPTTHEHPIYTVDGILHYCVANIPGAVPFTSTTALTNATLNYALALADKGWRRACADDPALAKGVNIVQGEVTFKAVADVFGLPYKPYNSTDFGPSPTLPKGRERLARWGSPSPASPWGGGWLARWGAQSADD